MNKTLKQTLGGENIAKNAWIAFGGLLALGVIALTIREIPAMRREFRMLRM